jgi:hypothetical protein
MTPDLRLWHVLDVSLDVSQIHVMLDVSQIHVLNYEWARCVSNTCLSMFDICHELSMFDICHEL